MLIPLTRRKNKYPLSNAAQKNGERALPKPNDNSNHQTTSCILVIHVFSEQRLPRNQESAETIGFNSETAAEIIYIYIWQMKTRMLLP